MGGSPAPVDTTTEREAVRVVDPASGIESAVADRPRGLSWLRLLLPATGTALLAVVVLADTATRVDSAPPPPPPIDNPALFPDPAPTAEQAPRVDVPMPWRLRAFLQASPGTGITGRLAPTERAAATAAVLDLVEAFERADSFGARESLHRHPAEQIVLPGFAGLPFDVRDLRKAFDPEPLADAVRYTAAFETSITLSDCVTSALVADAGQILVICDYTATSSLLILLGVPVSRGIVHATTRAGRVTSMEVTAPAELEAWRAFKTIAAASYDGAVFSPFLTGRPREATATAHLEAAAAFAGS